MEIIDILKQISRQTREGEVELRPIIATSCASPRWNVGEDVIKMGNCSCSGNCGGNYHLVNDCRCTGGCGSSNGHK